MAEVEVFAAPLGTEPGWLVAWYCNYRGQEYGDVIHTPVAPDDEMLAMVRTIGEAWMAQHTSWGPLGPGEDRSAGHG